MIPRGVERAGEGGSRGGRTELRRLPTGAQDTILPRIAAEPQRVVAILRGRGERVQRGQAD